jgi:hypothetical protein
VVPVVVVFPKPVEIELVNEPVPNPVEPNGLLAEIGDCVVACDPNMDVLVEAGVVVAVLNVNGEVWAGCAATGVL